MSQTLRLIYAYVNADPINSTDPLGLYTCTGTIQMQCDAVDQAIEDIKKARSKFMTGSKQWFALSKSLKALGTKGDNNGVNITFGSVPGEGAQVVPGAGRGTVDVTFDTGIFNLIFGKNVPSQASRDNFASMVAHEGFHVKQISDTGTLATVPSVYRDREYEGYLGQAYTLQGLNTQRSLYPTLWNPSWAPQSIETQQQKNAWTKADQAMRSVWCINPASYCPK